MHLDIPKLGDSIVGISSIIYIYIYLWKTNLHKSLRRSVCTLERGGGERKVAGNHK